MTTATDTPRTDAAKSYWDSAERENCVSIVHARQLERELAASQAEVERLKANLHRAIAIADVLRSGGSRACRELHHSKKDQHEYGDVCPVEGRLEKASEELDGLKAALNHTNKRKSK
jgi:uncharacterized small protein (DUF1192 family)